MNSISRAVTSKISEISNRRQRLDGQMIDDLEDFKSDWNSPSTSNFNYYDPPTLIIPEEDWRETPILALDGKASPNQKSPTNGIAKKVTSVVRKLSPFGNAAPKELTKEVKTQTSPTNGEKTENEKKPKLFKDTRDKVDKLKKSFKSKDQECLIDTDEE